MCATWFDRLVEKWIGHCELAGIGVDDIERARAFIDGEAYESEGWSKPPSLQALQAWFLAARDLCEREADDDELMGSELWRILSLTEKAYQMGLADAKSRNASE